MGQVPEFTKYLIIGSGRVAKNFQQYLKLIDIPFSSYSRNNDKHFNTYSAEIDNQMRLLKSAKDCSHVLLLISDSAIDGFVKLNQQFLNNKQLIHMSGALNSEFAVGAHPLMTFTHRVEADVDFYKSIPFIYEQGLPFQRLLPKLNNHSVAINREQKPLYHALCVASGNFTVMLWQEVFKAFQQELNIPKHILFPYLTKTTENLLTDSQHALTGPLQRRDLQTIQVHLQALENTNLKNLYLEFLKIKNINPTSGDLTL